jgi:hypothetical protein
MAHFTWSESYQVQPSGGPRKGGTPIHCQMGAAEVGSEVYTTEIPDIRPNAAESAHSFGTGRVPVQA